MENELQANQPQGTSLILSEPVKEIARVIIEVNSLLGYKLDVQDVVQWSRDIDRLLPGIEPERIAFLLDQYKTTRFTWDTKLGIQNIFIGLKWIGKTESGYEIKMSHTW